MTTSSTGRRREEEHALDVAVGGHAERADTGESGGLAGGDGKQCDIHLTLRETCDETCGDVEDQGVQPLHERAGIEVGDGTVSHGHEKAGSPKTPRRYPIEKVCRFGDLGRPPNQIRDETR